MLRLISCTKHHSHNKTGTAVFFPVIFKGISCFRCELHAWWMETRLRSDQMHNQSGCFHINALWDVVSIHSEKERIFPLFNWKCNWSQWYWKKATELRQQEWIEANCGNIRLSEHGFNATDCCPHRLNKTLFSTGFTTCEPHATHSESRTGCPSAPLLVKYVCA